MFETGGVAAVDDTAASGTLARLDALLAAAGALCDPRRDAGAWSGAERARALRALDRLTGVLATVRSGLLVAEQRAETSLRPGDRDFTAARARTTRTGLGDARRDVRRAETLVALPAMAEAVSRGQVPLPHVDALARIAATAGGQASQVLHRPDVADRLVGMARRLTVREFSTSAARLLATADPSCLERGVEAQRRERYLVLSHQPDGTFVRGRLDRLSGEVLRVALASVRQAPGEDRDKTQADADALVALAERALSGMAGVRQRRDDGTDGGSPGAEQDVADAQVTGVANRPSVSVLVPAETFAELRRVELRRSEQQEGHVRGSEDASGRGAGRESADAPLRPVEPAALEDGTPLAMSQLARMLCDCEIGRVVVSADGLPLDVGRTRRVFTGAQRRAVIVRDRGCAWNGCDVPAAFCEVHHIRWWDRDDGATDVANGVLLCSHHHHAVHRNDLTIGRLERPTQPPSDPGGEIGPPPLIGEPIRYVFRRRGTSGVVNSPPDLEELAA
ncbi:HNH endonuclease [Actinotalea sp. M2MS4P-6]|uniref:HNH endonuclease signature motif containing protein n=1 Tax=Actinotalea sp. M2MS4P-6 TaxID=2983762 RepID=UPI0021E4D654|nr:HNH endonuclease signature motif containing protein [Actinotalea sp. M2MS4P-6]MCV2393640.1 HNH endonuclease [Actinotalea sp. M2MS4P-6]